MPSDKKPAAKPPKGDQPAAKAPQSSPLEARVARIEKQVAQMGAMFGQKGGVHVDGTCDKCTAPGEVVKTDSFTGRDYIHFKDKNNHTWFEERTRGS